MRVTIVNQHFLTSSRYAMAPFCFTFPDPPTPHPIPLVNIPDILDSNVPLGMESSSISYIDELESQNALPDEALASFQLCRTDPL
jgi:hypothetical protein